MAKGKQNPKPKGALAVARTIWMLRKWLNAVKVKELMKTHNEYPAEVGTLISCFRIMNTDLRFLQDDHEIKKQVEVQLGPFACFALRKVATAIQKYIVPWSIAMCSLSFQKMQTIEKFR